MIRTGPPAPPNGPSAPVTGPPVTGRLAAALAAATEDGIVYDLAGIAARHDDLLRHLPGVAVRFALKSCPADEVVGRLAALGAGVDAAGPNEITQALRAGVPAERIHYGNTVKSDRDIAAAYRLGVRLFATDSLADTAAIAAHAPGARVFCRLATDGEGALWGLTDKYGCSPADAVRVLERAREAGLVPSGLSVHVGSQQMTADAWRAACERLADVLAALARRGIRLDHVNLGGGLPALGYLDGRGRPLEPPLDKVFAVIREGMQLCREAAAAPLDFVMEPGRYLVADHGAVRAHVVRLTTRQRLDGSATRWLYLSCGKFNGLYEMDELRYPLVFPTHPDGPRVPAVVAGPSCDSADAHAPGRTPVPVPEGLESGDPVWVLCCGAYALSYMTRGFNGFDPLPYTVLPSGEALPDETTPPDGEAPLPADAPPDGEAQREAAQPQAALPHAAPHHAAPPHAPSSVGPRPGRAPSDAPPPEPRRPDAPKTGGTLSDTPRPGRTLPGGPRPGVAEGGR